MEVIQKHWIIILKITFECQSLKVSQSLEADLIRKLEENQKIQAATSKKLSQSPLTWAGVYLMYLSGLLVKLTLAYFS